MILTSERHAKQPFAGRNTQHMSTGAVLQIKIRNHAIIYLFIYKYKIVEFSIEKNRKRKNYLFVYKSQIYTSGNTSASFHRYHGSSLCSHINGQILVFNFQCSPGSFYHSVYEFFQFTEQGDQVFHSHYSFV